jgi:hypothetical protein
VENKSIRKTAKYRSDKGPSQVPIPREELETLSAQFNIKFLLAIMNSEFALRYLSHIRKGDTDILPDEWKQLPIVVIPLSAQQPFIDLVDRILSEFQTYGYPLPDEPAVRVAVWEHQINEKVYEIYGITPNDIETLAAAAPTDLGETDDDEEA